jgi:hypothetical protein
VEFVNKDQEQLGMEFVIPAPNERRTVHGVLVTVSRDIGNQMGTIKTSVRISAVPCPLSSLRDAADDIQTLSRCRRLGETN